MTVTLVRLINFMVFFLSIISTSFYGECSEFYNVYGKNECSAFDKLEVNKCLNVKKIPNGIQMECGFSESDRLRVTKYYKLLATTESKRFNVKVSLPNGKINTVDIFDGVEIKNPFQNALNNKGCKIIDYSNFISTVGLKRGSLSDNDLKQQIEKLSSSSPLERGLAVVILGEMGNRAASAVPNLIKLLGDNTNLLEEEGPLDGLWPVYYSKIREEGKWPPSIDSVCAWAISEMGQLATESLIVALSDEDWRIKRYAIEILGNIGGFGAVEPLKAVLKDENWLVQEYAIRVLRKITGQDSSKWQRGKPSIEPMIATIKDKDEELGIRSEAVRALGEIKAGNSVETLIVLLNDHDISFTLRKDIVVALGETMDSRAVNYLQAALNDFFIRDEAAVALNKIKGMDFIKDNVSFQ